MTEGESSLDMHRVLIEIDEEVRAKRASGELPADLERELDLVFARFAPAGAVEGDFDQLLARAEQQSFLDLIAPNESVRPGVPQVKRVVQKTIRWYLRYVAEQFTGFAHTITRAVRQLGERTTALEQLTAPADELAAARQRSTAESIGDAPWAASLVVELTGTSGRVLHARCARGELVAALRTAGVDAYGLDIASDLVAAGTGSGSGLDLRPDDERTHLRTLSAGALGGLVLTECVDVLPRGAQIELADLAAVAIAQDGVLAIITTDPQAWDRSHSPIEVDLAPGRPMHVETWTHLLQDRGFASVDVRYGEPVKQLDRSPGTDTVAKAFNANVEALNALLFPPAWSLIIARR